MRAVLDEAANICPIRNLPDLYSYFGSMRIQVLSFLQSYQQGVHIWGRAGMDKLWSAATVKLIGAGVHDPAFCEDLSRLIGDHDVEHLHQHGRRGHRQHSTTREPHPARRRHRPLTKTHAVLLSTGRQAGLRLLPWYREPDHTTGLTAADINTTPPPPSPNSAAPPSPPSARPTPSPPPCATTTPEEAVMPHPDDTHPQPDATPPDAAARPEHPPPTGLADRPAAARRTAGPAHRTGGLAGAPVRPARRTAQPHQPGSRRDRRRRPRQTHGPSARHGGTRRARPGPGTPAEQGAIDGDALIDWVHRHVTAVIARPLRGDLRWCPQWWDHAEAVFRFEALRRAWTELAAEPGAACRSGSATTSTPACASCSTRSARSPTAATANASASSPPTPHCRPCPPSPQRTADHPAGGTAARPQPR